MKKIMLIVKESALEELKNELPELFENEEIVVEIIEDDDFDAYIEEK